MPHALHAWSGPELEMERMRAPLISHPLPVAKNAWPSTAARASGSGSDRRETLGARAVGWRIGAAPRGSTAGWARARTIVFGGVRGMESIRRRNVREMSSIAELVIGHRRGVVRSGRRRTVDIRERPDLGGRRGSPGRGAALRDRLPHLTPDRGTTRRSGRWWHGSEADPISRVARRAIGARKRGFASGCQMSGRGGADGAGASGGPPGRRDGRRYSSLGATPGGADGTSRERWAESAAR